MLAESSKDATLESNKYNQTPAEFNVIDILQLIDKYMVTTCFLA